VNEYGLPDHLGPEERREWLLGEVAAGRAVIVGEEPEWGITAARCLMCGLIHVNVIRISFGCRRCGFVTDMGASPEEKSGPNPSSGTPRRGLFLRLFRRG
jgi:hypothetical protein